MNFSFCQVPYEMEILLKILGTPELFRNFENSYPLFNEIRSFFIFFKATKCSGFIARSPSSFSYILNASLAKSIALWYSLRSVKVNNVQKLSFELNILIKDILTRYEWFVDNLKIFLGQNLTAMILITGTPPLMRKNRVEGKSRYRRSILVLKSQNGEFEGSKSTFLHYKQKWWM